MRRWRQRPRFDSRPAQIFIGSVRGEGRNSFFPNTCRWVERGSLSPWTWREPPTAPYVHAANAPKKGALTNFTSKHLSVHLSSSPTLPLKPPLPLQLLWMSLAQCHLERETCRPLSGALWTAHFGFPGEVTLAFRWDWGVRQLWAHGYFWFNVLNFWFFLFIFFGWGGGLNLLWFFSLALILQHNTTWL